mmetsp:Transcript_62783/g.111968  ORF Transcript_62783/g.111968 Transcript_62783/m.111968 type:complete len:301 (-) Transcript_62783:151-1053(-)
MKKSAYHSKNNDCLQNDGGQKDNIFLHPFHFSNCTSCHCLVTTSSTLPREDRKAGRNPTHAPIYDLSFSLSRSWITIPSPIPTVMPSPCLWFLSSSVLHRSLSLCLSRSLSRSRSRSLFLWGRTFQACPACSRAATAARRSSDSAGSVWVKTPKAAIAFCAANFSAFDLEAAGLPVKDCKPSGIMITTVDSKTGPLESLEVAGFRVSYTGSGSLRLAAHCWSHVFGLSWAWGLRPVITSTTVDWKSGRGRSPTVVVVYLGSGSLRRAAHSCRRFFPFSCVLGLDSGSGAQARQGFGSESG